jgi:hypothetical protein
MPESTVLLVCGTVCYAAESKCRPKLMSHALDMLYLDCQCRLVEPADIAWAIDEHAHKVPTGMASHR